MMNFNPLFIGQTNTAGTISSSATKLGKSSYLFSDIIKVILEDESAMQLTSDLALTELNENKTLNFSTTFQNLPQITSLTRTRITSDFIELSSDEIPDSIVVDETEIPVENEIDLNKNDLQQLFLSLAGYTPETKAGITTAETEAIDKLVTTVSTLTEGESISVQIEGLEEQLQVEIIKNENPLKEFTAKFVTATAGSQTDSKLPIAEIISSENLITDPKSVNDLTQSKISNSDFGSIVDKTPNLRVSNDTQPLKENFFTEPSDKHFDTLNKPVELPLSKQTFSDLSKLNDIKEIKPELKNTSLNSNNKNDINAKAETITKNVVSGTIPIDLKSELNFKEIKTGTKPIVKIDSPHTEQIDVKQSDVSGKTILTDTNKPELNGIKLSSKTVQTENVTRIQTSDTQKVIRLTLNNPEQINLREVLNSINQGEVKNSIRKEIQKLSVKENVSSAPKSEVTSKLEQNVVRLNSKVNLDEVTSQKPEIKFDKKLTADNQASVNVKEDSFAKLSVLNKQVLTSKAFDKSELIQIHQTSGNNKIIIPANSPDTFVDAVNTTVKSKVNELVDKSKNGIVKEFQITEKPSSETSNVKNPVINAKNSLTDNKEINKPQTSVLKSAAAKQSINGIQTDPNKNLNKEIFVEDKKLSSVQIPVKELSEIKQTVKNFKTDSSKNLNKEIVVEDKKLSNVQTPVKESIEIKQTIKDFKTDSNKNLNKEIVVEDKKLSNVQTPVKESTEIKQTVKNFKTESSKNLNKEIVVEDKKLSNVQIPIKESAEIKHTINIFKPDSNKNLNKEIVVEDKKLSNVQIPVKESSEIKQAVKNFKTDSNKNLYKENTVEDKKLSTVQIPVKETSENKLSMKEMSSQSDNHSQNDLKINSSSKESFLQNHGDENKNSSSRQNQNQFQANEAQVISTDHKYAAQVPVAKNSVEKPVQESSDKTTKENSSDNIKIELNPKPAIQDSNTLSKEKIVTETRNINEAVKTIRSSEIVKELSNFVRNGETQTVTFKVVPENLGKIKVSLDVSDNIAKATIEVETETVKQIVQSNIESLKQSLTQNGITVNSINVSLTGNQQKHNRPVDSKRKMNDNAEENKIETDSDSLLRKNLGYNTYEYLI